MADIKRLLEKGYSLAREGKLDKALKYFETAFSEDPRCVDALYGQGAVHYRLGDHRRAQELFSRVLNMEPTHERAIKYLHRCEGEIEKATPRKATEAASSWNDTIQWGGIESSRSVLEASDSRLTEEETSPLQANDTPTQVQPSAEYPSTDTEKTEPAIQKPKKAHKAVVSNPLRIMWICGINLILLIVFALFLYAAASIIRGSISDGVPKSLSPGEVQYAPGDESISSETGTESDVPPESLVLDESDQPFESLFGETPEDAEGSDVRERRRGEAVLPELLALLGLTLAILPYIGFVVSAFQEGVLKGWLFLCCGCYALWFILIEYKSESKWLHIGVYLLGCIIALVAHLLGSELARYVLRRFLRI